MTRAAAICKDLVWKDQGVGWLQEEGAAANAHGIASYF